MLIYRQNHICFFFCQREFDAKPLPVALEMTGWPLYGFRLSTGVETSASLITYNLSPLQTRRHCGFVAPRRSAAGAEVEAKIVLPTIAGCGRLTAS